MKLAIVLLTYNRMDCAVRTLEAVLKNIKTEHTLYIHIADDGSDGDYVKELHNLAWDCEHEAEINDVTVSITNRKGYGGSYNAAMRTLLDKVDYVLPLEDDWQLTDTLDLDFLTGVLEDEPRINCIRLGYIGYFHPLFAEFLYVRNHHFLLLDPKSPSQYIFSGHPRLERISYTKELGPWTEGLGAGETEIDVCSRPQSRNGVAWPVDLIKPSGGLFVHIGGVSVKDAPLIKEVAI